MPVEMSVFSSSGHPDDGVESLVSEGVYSRRRRQSVVPTRNDMQSVLEDRCVSIWFHKSGAKKKEKKVIVEILLRFPSEGMSASLCFR